ncbi:MAG: hypothetical protein ACK55I_30605, partial [bacterium]
MAGNSSWDQADGKNLVWFGELERKFSQIIKDYFHLPFFLLIILCLSPGAYYIGTVYTNSELNIKILTVLW